MLTAGIALASLVGCREDVTAVLGTGKPFSLFGVLSPQLDSQWVRVFPVEDVLIPAVDEALDAQFISTSLTTGEQVVWRDSIIEDPFGQKAHVFWAPFRAEFGHSYRLDVRSSSGESSSVEVSVPDSSEIVVQPPSVISTIVRLPVRVEGDAPRLLRIEVDYAVGYRPAGQENTSDEVTIPYDGVQERTGSGWTITIDPDSDFRTILEVLARRHQRPLDRDYGIILHNIRLRLIVGNVEWSPPGGIFDVNEMVQPDVMTNVENGFGFVGAGYRLEENWLPPAEAILRAGFRVQGQ